MVRRDVVRLVTPGTLTEDTLLDARRNNYLLAIARARASSTDDASRFALAWIDISTGEFRIAECDRAGLAAEIARLEPGEIIVSDALYADAELAPLSAHAAGGDAADRATCSTAPPPSGGSPAISRSRPPRRSARCRGSSSPRPRPASPMWSARSSASGRRCRRRCARRRARRSSIDQATRANLELMRTLGGERRGSLLAAIDRTVTRGRLAPAGAAARRAADRSRRDRARGSTRSTLFVADADRRAATTRASSARRARPGARAVAAGARPRRPARPRRHPRRARGRGGTRRARSTSCARLPAEIAQAR